MQLANRQVVGRPTARPGAGRRTVVVTRASIELKNPPYALDALEPHMSKQTLEFHWGERVDLESANCLWAGLLAQCAARVEAWWGD
jgi:hypothetical protein